MDEYTLPRGMIETAERQVKQKEVKCPVVETYQRERRVRENAVPIIKPRTDMPNIKLDPRVKLADVERQYILLALQECGGSVTRTCSLIGVSRNTVYRILGKRYYKTKTVYK